MRKWLKVWTVHEDCEIQLPTDSASWPSLPYITTDMLVQAILSFKWKTAAGPSKLQPRSLWFLSRDALGAMAAFFMKCEDLLLWP
eukprot:839391-Pyramimonas_sp.AAC.1